MLLTSMVLGFVALLNSASCVQAGDDRVPSKIGKVLDSDSNASPLWNAVDPPLAQLADGMAAAKMADGLRSGAKAGESAHKTLPLRVAALPNDEQTAAAHSSKASTNSTVGGQTVRDTILVLARNNHDAYNAFSGLLAYGIPYEVLIVPQSGVILPALSNSSTQGNYGGFIVVSELSYQGDGGRYFSGLTDSQYNEIYHYQRTFGIRMTRLDTFPWAAFGAKPVDGSSGCCDYQVEQLIEITNSSGFSTANLREGAGVSTGGLWHYPAVITDHRTTWEIAAFGPSSDGKVPKSTAAVINDFDGRQQMVFFTGWATEWSSTSTYLQHAYIHWMTRGLFLGARKVYLNLQIDDVHLRTKMYSPANTYYRTVAEDFRMLAEWQKEIKSRLPSGSEIFLELGHNGNGDIIAATNIEGYDGRVWCTPDDEAIYYAAQSDTPLEFQKPAGTGKSIWPDWPVNFDWPRECAAQDNLTAWFLEPENLNNFAHVSHTFTHLHENNATYKDVDREIRFNQQWMDLTNISAAARFSRDGLIPPGITGMHNGDAIRAWYDNGIRQVVGDNSRPSLLNQDHPYWALDSTIANNGFEGMFIMPRWPTDMYYDCDTPACTTQEWTDRFSGTGKFSDLLDHERDVTTHILTSLHHDPFMFHQANLRCHNVPTTEVGQTRGKLSLAQIWVETVTQELGRLTDWPVNSLKHDDIAQKFRERRMRDECEPVMQYKYSSDGNAIVAVTVSARDLQCQASIPVTFPGAASGTNARDDRLGSEPLIKWVSLDGSPRTFALAKPVSVRH